MKSLKRIAAGCLMLALTGCIAEDFSDCPPQTNVTLNFRLPDQQGNCTFMDHISKVKTLVYDQEHKLVYADTTEKRLHDFQGVKMYLSPGIYRVVCWANTGQNTIKENLETHYLDGQPNGRVTYSAIGGGRRVTHGDAIYYAPNTVATRLGPGEGNTAGEYVMTVSARGHEGTLDFRHAHRRVEVYVKGFDAAGIHTPLVELTNLPHGLTLTGMKHLDDDDPVTASLRSELVEVGKDGEKGRFALAPFNLFYFRSGDFDIDVNLLDPADGSLEYTTKLHHHIDPDKDDPDKDMVIKLLIEFTGADVRVTIPDWETDEVGYGIFD